MLFPLMQICGRPRRVIRGDRPITLWLLLPLPRVPLPNEAALVLKVQSDFSIAYQEVSVLIAVCGGSQQIDAVVFAGR